MKKFVFIILLFFITISVYSQESPQIAPINPEFIEYLQNKSAGQTKEILEGEYKAGIIPSPLVYHFGEIDYAAKSTKTLPSSYDLRTVDGGVYLTPVKNQGAEGACWAFATYAAIESYWKKQGLPTYDLSEQNLATCHLFNLTPSDGGTVDMSIAYLARRSGPILEAHDPYTLPSNPNCVNGLTPIAYVSELRKLPGIGEPNFSRNVVKQAIVDYGALYTNMNYTTGYMSFTNNTYYYNGSGDVNHGVAIVGWDDNKVVTGGSSATPSQNGAWIIKNSWGPGWGESGYFYISYQDTKALSTIAYLPSYNEYNPNSTVYNRSLFGPSTSLGYGSHYAMIKYSVTENQQLEKVGTHVVAGNTNVHINIYSAFNGTSLLSGNLVASIPAQLCDLPGYYTFDLPAPITITEGSNFFIRVRYESSYTYPIPLDASIDGYNSNNFSLVDNTGWVSPNGSITWVALNNGTDNEYNVCINAYASVVATEMPTADFSASPTTIVFGNSVSFFDTSAGIPDEWEWEFEGGDPESSSIQYPIVTYNQPGTYDVKLTVTNEFGSNYIIKENFITVLNAPIECEYIDNFVPEDDIVFYTTTGGYVAGINAHGFTEFAEYYDSHLNNNLNGVGLHVVRASALSSNPRITLKVWGVVSGLPGTVLHSQDLNIADIEVGTTNYITFSESILVADNFFIGYQIYTTTPQDTFVVSQAADRGELSTDLSTAYIKYNNVWRNTDDLFQGGFNTSFSIFPEMCPYPPSANFTANITDGCDNLTVQFTNLSTANSESFYWEFGDGNESFEQNPEHTYNSPGVYTVSLTVTNPVSFDTKTLTDFITVGTTPTSVNVTGGGIACGGHLTLMAEGGTGGTIYWQGNISNGTNTDYPTSTYDVHESGTYYFRAMNENCWGIEGSADVTINLIPEAITVSGGGTICGNTAILNAEGGAGGTIYFQSTTSNGTSTINPTTSVSVTESNVYYFRARSSEGCWGEEASIEVILNPIPSIVTVTGGGTQCGGEMIINASGGEGGTIYFQGTVSNGESQDNSNTTQTINVSGIYFFRSVSSEGCWGEAGSTEVTINPVPGNVTVNGGTTQCGGSVTLTAGGGTGGTIYWQNQTSNGTDVSNASNSETVSESGTYYFRALSNEGCWGEEGSADVTIYPVPAAVTVSGSGSQCGGDMELTAEGGDGGTIYWQNQISNGTDVTYASYSEIVSESGTYYFRSLSPDGCWGEEGSAIVTIHPIPVVDLGDDVETCNEQVSLDAGPGFITYIWNDTPYNQQLTVGVSGLYTVIVHDSNGCTATDAIQVDIYPTPFITVSSTPETGIGMANGTATVDLTYAGTDLTIEWSTGSNEETIINLEAGYYHVTVTNEYDCSSTETVLVTVMADPIADFIADPVTGCNQLIVHFQDLSENFPHTWTWDFGDGHISHSQNPTHHYTSPGYYTVSLTVTNDYNNDTFTFEQLIQIGETPIFIVHTSPASGETAEDGEAWLEVSAGFEPLQIDWSTGEENTQHIFELAPGNYHVEIVDALNCYAYQEYTIDWVSSINTINNVYRIYPNPARSFVNINFENAENREIKITDISGKLVIAKTCTNQISRIDISKLSPGIYLININERIEKLIIE